jgi:hypothetical protein
MIKNFTLSRLSMLWIILLLSSPLLAQTDIVRGKISDDSGSGLPGVNIIIKGTSSGTTSDADGNYSLSIPASAAEGTLVFSFIGFTTQEQPINGRSSIDVTMAPDVQSLTEVVVTGYGTQEKRDVTAAISSIKGEAIARIPTPNAMDALKGQIAGVDVLQNGGRPGQAPTIRIRGRRSLTASNDPLFVIDGIPMTAGTRRLSGDLRIKRFERCYSYYNQTCYSWNNESEFFHIIWGHHTI